MTRAPRASRCSLRTMLLTGGLASCAAGATLRGQSVQVSGASSVRFIELRPFVQDSVPSDSAAGMGLLQQTADGLIVRCVPGDSYCHVVRPGDVAWSMPVIHDINASAWGIGRGVRALAQVRARTPIGDAGFWPSEDERFEVLALYGEVERDRIRLRAGRQWRTSGFGFFNFDGLTAGYRVRRDALIEVFGGRSLVRGDNATRTTEALESVEPVTGANRGVLVGVQAQYRPNDRLALGAVYHLDVRGDRSDAYAEVASASGTWRSTWGSADASLDVDIGGRAINLARVTLRSVPMRGVSAFLEGRQYRPFFELWTIWGAFSPVGFDEGRGGVTWTSADGGVIARGDASFRRYHDDETDAPDDIHTSGWGIGGSLTARASRDLTLDGSYRVEAGFGAARWQAEADVRHAFGRSAYVAVHGTAFRRLYEFRLDESTIVGAGVEGSVEVSTRLRAFASAMLYRQHGGDPAVTDWNQRRAALRLEWSVGGEPGAPSATGLPR